MAFESLSVISNALRWLEAGELAVCRYVIYSKFSRVIIIRINIIERMLFAIV